MLETEKTIESRYKHRAEAQEAGFEDKENKEEQEAKKAAARERVEQVARETKTTKQLMQNIIANMQQVIKSVRMIRQQLQLQADEDIPSVKKDQAILENLKKKLFDLQSQLEDLKKALLQEEKTELKKQNPLQTEAELEVRAQHNITEILTALGLEQ